MQIVIKYKMGVQLTELPQQMGKSMSQFDEKSGVSTEKSSLDTMPPSNLCFWQASDGSFYASRRAMRERGEQYSTKRVSVQSPFSCGGDDPKARYLILSASELPDVEFVEVDGIRIWTNPSGDSSRTEGTGLCRQARMANESISRGAEAMASKLRASEGVCLR